jgi:hypothetical protein
LPLADLRDASRADRQAPAHRRPRIPVVADGVRAIGQRCREFPALGCHGLTSDRGRGAKLEEALDRHRGGCYRRLNPSDGGDMTEAATIPSDRFVLKEIESEVDEAGDDLSCGGGGGCSSGGCGTACGSGPGT